MEEPIDFNAYLVDKKIDPVRFKESEGALYLEWMELFDQVSPASFSAQKLFLINPLRRKYHLGESKVQEAAKPKMAARPKFKRP